MAVRAKGSWSFRPQAESGWLTEGQLYSRMALGMTKASRYSSECTIYGLNGDQRDGVRSCKVGRSLGFRERQWGLELFP